MKLTLGILLALITSAAICPAQTATPPMPEHTKPENSQPAADAPPKAGARPYVIGALDVLDIRVWNDAKLSGMYDVRPDGVISMPLIGELKADGLTITELTKLIRTRLSATVTNEPPDVNIQPARINSQRIFMHGAVNRQGEMPLVGEMRILDAISNCGGFKDFAKPGKIYVLRGDKKFAFNYKDVSKAKHMEQNILLENGDHIFVPGE